MANSAFVQQARDQTEENVHHVQIVDVQLVQSLLVHVMSVNCHLSSTVKVNVIALQEMELISMEFVQVVWLIIVFSALLLMRHYVINVSTLLL